ncbi:hypothetical protein C8R44DRAFT_26785 [Mycena epipterygia]|nr:hypothetical protein C8R44DRAFT_26785 [Mycena epipterygia]
MTRKTQNLADGSVQALQALLQSLAPDSAIEGAGKLSPTAVRKLSEKLTQLVGDGSGEPQNRNEEGQLLNEEGLPIIDITEPILVPDIPQASLIPEEDAPIRLETLPVSEQERRRRERDRILDLLEEEEEAEQAREEGPSPEQRQEILLKRKKAAQDEMDRLKAAKDIQKKMGKALLRGMSAAREQTAPAEPLLPPKPVPRVEKVEVTPVPRKSVKFADAGNDSEAFTAETETSDWGDVIPARLRANSGRTLMSSAQIDAHPMKMQVVERIPGKPKLEEPQPDSDDESEPPDSPTVTDSDGFVSDEELAEEVDLDFARHQREIALQYHEKRVKMAETTSNAMMSHSHDHSVSHKTAEESLNQSSRKPAISHFQANRLTSSYNAATPTSSKSLGANVLPATSAQTLQHAIRIGKLDSDNHLVGGDAGESGSDEEDDAAMQEIMELLKKGEVYNLGPDGNMIHAVPPSKPPAGTSVATTDAPPPPSSRKPPTSKFKLARSGQRPFAAAPSSPNVSDSPTPPSNAARSSPKLSTPIAESQPVTPSPRADVLSSAVVERSASSVAFAPMVVESPSFPETRRPHHPPTVVRAADRPAKVSRFLAERME